MADELSPPRVSSGESPHADLALRLLVTALACGAYFALRHTPLPYASRVWDAVMGTGAGLPSSLAFAALGVTPFLSASAAVELVAVAIPALRKRRHGGPAARRSLDRSAVGLGVLFAVLQAAGVCLYLAQVPEAGLTKPELATMVGVLVATTSGLYVAGRWVDVRGIGPGVFAIAAFGWLCDLVSAADARRLAFGVAMRGGAQSALVVGAILFVLPFLVAFLPSFRRYFVREAPRGLALPASGWLPVGVVAGMFSLLSLVARRSGDWWPTLSLEARLVGVGLPLGVVAIVLGALFVPRVAWLRTARAAGVDAGAWERARNGSIVGSAIGLVLVTSVVTYLDARRHDLELVALLAAFPHILAWLLDAYDELALRLAHGPLERAAELHAPFAVPAIVAVLDAAAIPHVIRASRARAVLQVLGAYAPLVVLVPPSDLGEARRLVTPVLRAITEDVVPERTYGPGELERVFE